jgi:hypothetical protein
MDLAFNLWSLSFIHKHSQNPQNHGLLVCAVLRSSLPASLLYLLVAMRLASFAFVARTSGDGSSYVLPGLLNLSITFSFRA